MRPSVSYVAECEFAESSVMGDRVSRLENSLRWWRESSSFTLSKLECLKQPLGALNTLAWDNGIGLSVLVFVGLED